MRGMPTHDRSARSFLPAACPPRSALNLPPVAQAHAPTRKPLTHTNAPASTPRPDGMDARGTWTGGPAPTCGARARGHGSYSRMTVWWCEGRIARRIKRIGPHSVRFPSRGFGSISSYPIVGVAASRPGRDHQLRQRPRPSSPNHHV